MKKLFATIAGAILAVITILFFKTRPNISNKEEKDLEKKVKDQKKQDKEISKKHKEVADKTSQKTHSVTERHDKRKVDMGDLFKEKVQ